jgi:hypothetical protein
LLLQRRRAWPLEADRRAAADEASLHELEIEAARVHEHPLENVAGTAEIKPGARGRGC